MEWLLNNAWVKWAGPTTRKHRPNWSLLVLAGVLSLIGLVVQYSIGPAIAAQGGSSIGESFYFVRHAISLIIGLVAFGLAYKIPIKIWMALAPAMMIAGIVLALATVVSGGTGNRWLQIGFFSFQPAEAIKVAIALGGGLYLSQVNKGRRFKEKPWLVLQNLILLLGVIGLVLVVWQKDLGSMVVITAMIAAMLWVAKLPFKHFAVLATIIVLLGTIFIGSVEYRRERFNTFLNPTEDCSDEGYQACQALISIGSGGLFGKGIGESVQVYGYLPEANNDSVFAIYAEIVGFVGVTVLLGVMYKYYSQIFAVSRHSEEALRYVVVGILTWFSVQSFMNIGAMIGLLPLKGITLPFISYGGSSLMLVLFAAGLLLQISAYTRYSNENEDDKDKDSADGGRVGRTRYTSRRPR